MYKRVSNCIKYIVRLLALALLFTPCVNSAAELIQFDANESPPYWSANMEGQGLCGEILHALSKETGLTAKINFKPLKRLIEDTKNNDLGNPLFYIETQDFAGIIPIALYQISFYYYKPNHPKQITLNNLNDLKKYKIGILKGTLIDQLAFEQLGIVFESSYKQSSIFKKLKLGRIDLAIEINLIAQQLINQLYPEQSHNFAHISISEKPSAIALMINEEMPDAKKIVQRYREALTRLIAKGRYQQILEKYYIKTPIPINWYSELARYDRLYNFDLSE